MSAPAFGTAQPELQRDQWGRPLVIPPDGGKAKAYTRCTTYVDCLEDKYNLQKWQQRMVALGLAQRDDLLLRAASLGREPIAETEQQSWKRTMDEVCEAASEAAKSSAAATIGTSLHALCEQLDLGRELGAVPPAYRGHLAAYQEATSMLTSAHVERFTVNDELQVGGTPDRVVEVDGHDGLFIADIKTGTTQFGVGKMSMQLAIYAHSQLYDVATGRRGDLGPVSPDRGLIIALDARTGACEVKWLDLAAGWEAVQIATQVRAWRKASTPKRLFTPFTSAEAIDTETGEILSPAAVATALSVVPDPDPGLMLENGQELTKVAALMVAIERARTYDELTQLWAAAGPLWNDQMTDLAARRRQEIAA